MSYFSFLNFTSSLIDDSYTSSRKDILDTLSSSLFPIAVVTLYNASRTGPIKRILLPILDDILYNIIVWGIPLAAFLVYDHHLTIFYYLSAAYHGFYSFLAIIKRDRMDDLHEGDLEYVKAITSAISIINLTLCTIYIVNLNHLDSTSVMFLTSFSLLIGALIFINCFYCIKPCLNERIANQISTFSKLVFPISLYVSNILQTFYIVMYWPINFYFVKLCMFTLGLYLTRGVSYVNGKIPGDFLATSAAKIQCTFSNKSEVARMEKKISPR